MHSVTMKKMRTNLFINNKNGYKNDRCVNKLILCFILVLNYHHEHTFKYIRTEWANQDNQLGEAVHVL